MSPQQPRLSTGRSHPAKCPPRPPQMLLEARGQRVKSWCSARCRGKARSGVCPRESRLLKLVIKIDHAPSWHICPCPPLGRGTGGLQWRGLHHTATAWGSQKPFLGGKAFPWPVTEPGCSWRCLGMKAFCCPASKSSETREGERKTESKGGKQYKEGRLSLLCHPFLR